MAKSHYYLVDPSVITKGTAVSKIQFLPMTEEPFLVHGLKVGLWQIQEFIILCMTISHLITITITIYITIYIYFHSYPAL